MALKDIDEAIGQLSGNSRTVLEYAQIMKRLVREAKQPGFSEASWAPLAELVATDAFVRVGNYKEVMNWRDYVAFLTEWAPTAEWDGSFKRATEGEDVVLLELEERITSGGRRNVVNSVTVYEFDATGKIRHLDVYLQMARPDGAVASSGEDMAVSA